MEIQIRGGLERLPKAGVAVAGNRMVDHPTPNRLCLGVFFQPLHLLAAADLRVRHPLRTRTSFLVDELSSALFAYVTFSGFAWHLYLLPRFQMVRALALHLYHDVSVFYRSRIGLECFLTTKAEGAVCAESFYFPNTDDFSGSERANPLESLPNRKGATRHGSPLLEVR